jgi:hypothetical protein
MDNRGIVDPHTPTLPSDQRDGSGQQPSKQRLETDGPWCAMAHGNQKVNSFQACPPLMRVKRSKKIISPILSQQAAQSLGSFSGEKMAVCSYSSTRYPALVAFNYEDESILWTSPMQDLPGKNRRGVSAILLAKFYTDENHFQRLVFSGNSAEFVAYRDDGTCIWKQKMVEISPSDSTKIGAPISINFNDAGELITVTDKGWVIKLRPEEGSVIDAYNMESRIIHQRRVYQGTFISLKSVVVIGNTLYLAAEFRADPITPLNPVTSPVYLLRINLAEHEVLHQKNKIQHLSQPRQIWDEVPDRLAIGINVAGGSPSALVTSTGKVLLFANSEVYCNGQRRPLITAVEDDHGILRRRWWCVLMTGAGEAIFAAPALHEESRTLLVNTPSGIFVFRNVDSLEGNVPSPPPINGLQLAAYGERQGIARIGVGSPFALASNHETEEIIGYTNFRMVDSLSYRWYGFLGAFALPAHGQMKPRPLWSRPLAITASGDPAPGPGTYGQPALFRYECDTGEATGMIVNTVCTGTYILK